ncbi:MAG: acetylxylan esterase [Blastocatellia bacterium]
MIHGRLIRLIAVLAITCAAAQAQPPAFVPNYDEAKVGTFSLPDPLVMADGTKVADARQWRKRRSEILRLFETHVYGKTPAARAPIQFEEVSRDAAAVGGLATRREIAIWLLGKKGGPRMNLLLYVPNGAAGPAPAFLGMNFNGNHAIEADPKIALDAGWMRRDDAGGVINNRATEKSRGSEAGRWALEMILKRGYAVATFYCGDLFPDHKDGLKDSIIPHLSKPGQAAPAEDEWNAMGAWAWGLSRAMDFFERDKAVDARRVAVIGHSRLGKAALWAGAQDERFAVIISNESGEGGAALARRTFGETVGRINDSFPHWFCANYKKYNARVNDLPVDQHLLIAALAPRPVYVASAAEDLWADPRGEFLSAQAASPVYRLLGREAIGDRPMPELQHPIMTTVGYHIRAGKHDVTNYDWEQYLKFADLHLKRK